MQKFKFNKKNILIIAAVALIIALLFAVSKEPRNITYSQYMQLMEGNFIDKAVIDGDEILLYAQNNRFSIIKEAIDLKELIKKVPVERNTEYITPGMMWGLGIFLCFLLWYTYIFRAISKKDESFGKKDGAFEIENVLNQNAMPVISNVRFSDVAGISEVKSELSEIVDFLKNPQKYRNFGIKMPKGVLMIGPPGVGKTLVAKAVAGEANVPFFYQNGASFVQIYVGMGAKRVRELFSRAKSYAPSIIFIDEIDAVGKSRGGARNDEREATLNQLLTEMDGFEDNSGVIVIAATNRIEMIDEALLRSGRFDRRIFLSMPDYNDRVAILNTYLKDKNCEVPAEDIARMSVGFSGAALSTLVNEAAINALRNGESVLRMRDFEAVLNKVLLGKKKVLSYSESEKKIQAIYQGAKALSAYWFDVKFEKISLIEDRFMATEQEIESKSQMLSRIKVLISGMCKLEIDENDIFSNSSNDLNLAKEIASKMVYEYGMGNSFVPNPNDVEEILKQAKEEIISFLKGTNEQIARISSYLLAYESVDKETLAKILNENY
ncbi:ATP-dependent metallopeptidase FtsH/Yme1/Tma family protein [Campylobacter concisus]|uniref:ATP-dependent metallopeptidase FtsH/Yme1/Tma family protein n=1 Tax=Campylobacter concisus TaxID=199 RepID=A0A7S9RJI2_9BACT|nr:ATP-dependent metallopeptidase FtsH/Yme1/Tma family protein [Campylobacter concisus]QPH92856.1 ATP-dependent metallopeptidase FtsH/Yme1/Tma family protein [Campylobacter concisus]